MAKTVAKSIAARKLPASVKVAPKVAVVKADDTKVQQRFCFDAERRTCLTVSQNEDTTKFIPLETESGLCVCSTSTKQFNDRFTTVPNHNLSRGAAIYARYAVEIGATPEVMSFLGNFTPITKQEIAMATNRKKTNEEATATKKVAAKEKAKKVAEPKAEKAPFTGGKKVTVVTTTTAPKVAGEKKPTASKMFCDLIMEGKLSDDKIFEKVQKTFGLDDNKKSYVRWYRQDMKKKGLNPPEAK